MTFAEAAGIMIGGSGGTSELPKPDQITYQDAGSSSGSSGIITEHYNVGTDNEYTKKIEISFSNKGTPNETVSSLNFYDKDGNHEGYISFSGFYVG